MGTKSRVAMRGRLKQASLSLLAAILGLAHLGAASPPSEDLQRARVARDAFYRCALMTTPEYDDGISPANVVAKAVAFKCQTWVNTMVKYLPQAEGTELSKEIMRGEEGNLLGVVLRHRVLKSTPSTPLATGGAGAPARPSAGSVQPRTAPRRNAAQ